MSLDDEGSDLHNEGSDSSDDEEGELIERPLLNRKNMPEGLNLRIAFAIAAGAIGSSFQHGYNTGVLNAPQSLIERWIRGDCDNSTSPGDGGAGEGPGGCMDDTTVTLIWSWVVAIFCVGGMIGGSMVGFASSYFGRKTALLLNNILVVFATLLMGLSKMAGSYQMLIAGRLLIGINSGLNAGLAPMYLSEIAPTKLRGAVGTVYQLIITISILLSQILGMSNVLGTDNQWPLLLSLTIIPAIFQILTLPFCPESPKFLLLDRDDEIGANKGNLRTTSFILVSLILGPQERIVG
jgi:SP family facilitated glucose transporter-like MFS transporter 1